MRDVRQHFEQTMREPPLEDSFRIAPAAARGARRIERRRGGFGRRRGEKPAGDGARDVRGGRFALAVGAKTLAEALDRPALGEWGRRLDELFSKARLDEI